MIPQSFALIPVIICFTFGVVLGLFIDLQFFLVNFKILTPLCLVGAFLSRTFRKSNPFILSFFIGALSFLIGVNCLALSKRVDKEHYSNNYTVDQNNILNILITNKLRATNTHYRYYGTVIGVNGNKVKGRLLINLVKKHFSELELGLVIETSVFLQPIKEANNIGEFDYKLYLN